MKRFKLLSIFHYIWGGIYFFFGLLPFRIYFDFSRYIIQMRPSLCINEPFRGDACDSWIIFFTIAMHIFLLGFGTVNIMAGLFYQRAKPNTANWIAACVNLLSLPIGTALGIYSLLRLNNYLKELQESEN